MSIVTRDSACEGPVRLNLSDLYVVDAVVPRNPEGPAPDVCVNCAAVRRNLFPFGPSLNYSGAVGDVHDALLIRHGVFEEEAEGN